MKNLLYNILILVSLALMVAGIQSCSDELSDVGDVEVCFSATIPVSTMRSFGTAEKINTLVVGVFRKSVSDEHTDNVNYNEIYRKSFPIDGCSADVQLTLPQNQTYSFVFWAYDCNLNAYNIDDMTAIKMEFGKEVNGIYPSVSIQQMESMDAFYATIEDCAIAGNRNYSVELVRPLAQVNVGTAGTPMRASFTAKLAPNTFHPFTNTVSGSTNLNWTFSETTAETFWADNKQYNYLAMCYLFAPVSSTTIATELSLTNGVNSKMVEFPQVEIGANQRSNIAGSFTEME